MTKLQQPKKPKEKNIDIPKMVFDYSGAPQKSPEWFDIRKGKVTASRLEDWLAISVAEKTKGKPLKKRLDYERELRFEQAFDTTFDKFVTSAMEEGIFFEKYAAQAYAEKTGNTVAECGCWYSDKFVASPDRIVAETDSDPSSLGEYNGLLEIKVVKDTSFMEILVNGVPDKWWKQCQGQLWASKKDWCDFVALNLHTKRIKVIRIFPDKEFHEWLELAVPDELSVDSIDTVGVYDVTKQLPELSEGRFDKINAEGESVSW